MMKNLFLLIFLILIMTACNSTTVSNDTPTEPTQSNQEAVEEVPEIQESDSQLQLTLAQLAEFDGKDGRPAYIAVDGIIYDVSDARQWSNGDHNGFEAGQDLTDPLNNKSPHGASKLKNVPVIGILVETPESSDSTLPDTPTDESEKDSTTPEAKSSDSTEDTELSEVSNVNEEAPTQVTEISDSTLEASDESLSDAPKEVTEEITTSPTAEEVMDTDGNGLAEFTPEQLLAFNGLNGQPAYFAYKGLIYDVSHIRDWAGGEHNGNYAGYDLTDDLAYASHGEEKLKRAVVVGELVK